MLNTLHKILKLSQAIIEACNTEQWEDIETMQEQRAILMKNLKTMPTPDAQKEIDACREISLELQKLNDEILKLTHANKDSVFEAIIKSNKSKKMNSAYGK